jgi:hypothetical protein
MANNDLAKYLREAWQENKATYQQPAHGRPFRTPMFTFVRRARAHSELDGLAPGDAAELVRCILTTWVQPSDDPWLTLFPESDDPESEFADTWTRIKWPRSEVEHAHLLAGKLPLKPSRCCSSRYGSFVSLAGHLQRNVDGPILLPCRKIAEALECEPMTISRYRRLAIENGLLRLVARGIKSQRKADEFNFAVEMFDWETGMQIEPLPLSICVTSAEKDFRGYTETHDTQELERSTESKEIQAMQEIQEQTRKKRTTPSTETKVRISNPGPYVPTTAELTEALKKTSHLRRVV